MKKLITSLLVIASFASYAQWNIPTKYQPVLFKNPVVIGDTFGVDTGSMLRNYGQTIIIDTLEDGRAFFKSTDLTDSAYVLEAISDTATQIRSEIADSVALLRSDLADTSALLKSIITDSTKWVETAGGNSLRTKASGQAVIVGQSSEVSGVDFYVNGVSATNLVEYVIGGGRVMSVGEGNIFDVVPSPAPNDTIVGFEGMIDNTFITIVNSNSTTVVLSVSGFAGNSQTLRTPSGADVIISEFGMVTIYIKDEDEFYQYTTSINND